MVWQQNYDPFNNIILSAGFGALIPGPGFKDIYRRSTSPVPSKVNVGRWWLCPIS